MRTLGPSSALPVVIVQELGSNAENPLQHFEDGASGAFCAKFGSDDDMMLEAAICFPHAEVLNTSGDETQHSPGERYCLR